jgi:hypothetical protein
MRRRYRTREPRRGLLYLFLFLILAGYYVGQRLYAQQLQVDVGGLEQTLKNMSGRLETLRAERDRLTSLAVLTSRAGVLGLRPAQVTQLARIPLTLPEPLPEDPIKPGLGGAFARVWDWLDGTSVQKQEALAAP